MRLLHRGTRMTIQYERFYPHHHSPWRRYWRLSPDKNYSEINIHCWRSFHQVLIKLLTMKIHSFASRVARPSRSQFGQRYRPKMLWRPRHQSWRTLHWGPDNQYLYQDLFCAFSTSIFALSWSFSSMILYMSYSATSALSSGSCMMMVCNNSRRIVLRYT